MVVEAKFAAQFACLFHNREESLHGDIDLGLLFRVDRAGGRSPNLRSNVVFFKQSERLRVGAPKGKELDVVFFVLENFLLKLHDMFGPPVVGHPFESKLLEHLNPLGWVTFFRVERHDAPGD